MANQVQIMSQYFTTQNKAIRYFMDKCEDVAASGPITTGKYFEELKDLYTRYCKNTEYPLDRGEITAFTVDHEPRKNGNVWASHLCYSVHFSAPPKQPFSVKEAVISLGKVK